MYDKLDYLKAKLLTVPKDITSALKEDAATQIESELEYLAANKTDEVVKINVLLALLLLAHQLEMKKIAFSEVIKEQIKDQFQDMASHVDLRNWIVQTMQGIPEIQCKPEANISNQIAVDKLKQQLSDFKTCVNSIVGQELVEASKNKTPANLLDILLLTALAKQRIVNFNDKSVQDDFRSFSRCMQSMTREKKMQKLGNIASAICYTCALIGVIIIVAGVSIPTGGMGGLLAVSIVAGLVSAYAEHTANARSVNKKARGIEESVNYCVESGAELMPVHLGLPIP
ncbi:MAG: hypothetical protein H0U71_01835 [Gammaproteobacteria bacterium]|nr:hypothetical protein [Gammaproteobacteria bacterium]